MDLASLDSHLLILLSSALSLFCVYSLSVWFMFITAQAIIRTGDKGQEPPLTWTGILILALDFITKHKRQKGEGQDHPPGTHAFLIPSDHGQRREEKPRDNQEVLATRRPR